MHASVDLLPDGHIVQHFGVATSPNVADLFTSFIVRNEYEPVVLPIIIVFVGFQEHQTSTIWNFEH